GRRGGHRDDGEHDGAPRLDGAGNQGSTNTLQSDVGPRRLSKTSGRSSRETRLVTIALGPSGSESSAPMTASKSSDPYVNEYWIRASFISAGIAMNVSGSAQQPRTVTVPRGPTMSSDSPNVPGTPAASMTTGRGPPANSTTASFGSGSVTNSVA